MEEKDNIETQNKSRFNKKIYWIFGLFLLLIIAYISLTFFQGKKLYRRADYLISYSLIDADSEQAITNYDIQHLPEIGVVMCPQALDVKCSSWPYTVEIDNGKTNTGKIKVYKIPHYPPKYPETIDIKTTVNGYKEKKTTVKLTDKEIQIKLKNLNRIKYPNIGSAQQMLINQATTYPDFFIGTLGRTFSETDENFYFKFSSKEEQNNLPTKYLFIKVNQENGITNEQICENKNETNCDLKFINFSKN